MTPDEIAEELERRWAQFQQDQRERLAEIIGDLITDLDDDDDGENETENQ